MRDQNSRLLACEVINMSKNTISKDTIAQVGIGTLIIFIAMVLVSAVAAAVLIQTSGVLQQKAQQTGMETLTEISGNLVVEIITGERSASDDPTLDKYDLLIRVAAGAGRIDLQQLVIIVEDQNNCSFLTFDNNNFSLTEIRDEDDSFQNSNAVYVINSGDLIKISINATNESILSLPRSQIAFTIIPEAGNPVRIDVTTPNSFGIDKVVRIYPVSTT